MEREVIKTRRASKNLGADAIPSLTEIERRRLDDVRSLIEQLTQSLSQVDQEIEACKRFDANAANLNAQQHAKLQDIALAVNETRESFYQDTPSPNSEQKAQMLEDLLSKIYVEHEYLGIDQAFSKSAIKDLDLHWVQLTSALQNYRDVTSRIDDVSHDFTSIMSDFRKISDAFSGRSRRKFFWLDRFGPIVFVFSGCAIMIARWLLGIKLPGLPVL